MTPKPPSKPFTMAVAVGGVPTTSYGDANYYDLQGDGIGTDGLQPISVDGNGNIQVKAISESPIGEGVPAYGIWIAAEYSGNLVGLQADSAGRLLVDIGGSSGTVTTADTVLDATVGTPATAHPTTGVQVGGNDGTDFRNLLTDNTGQLKVLLENWLGFEFDGSGNLKVNVETGGGGSSAAVGLTAQPVPIYADYVGGNDLFGGTGLIGLSLATDGKILLSSESDTIAVTSTPETSGLPIYGQYVVTATAAQVIASEPLNTDNPLQVSARTTNTGVVYLGDAGVNASSGYILEPGKTVPISINDVSGLYALGTAGDIISWLGT